MSSTFSYQGPAGPDGQPVAVHADPLDIHLRLLVALGNGANAILAAAQNQQEPATAAEARLRLIGAVREVFGLPAIDPFTGQGIGAKQVEEALRAFLFFQWAAKQPTASSATSSQPTPPGKSRDPAAL